MESMCPVSVTQGETADGTAQRFVLVSAWEYSGYSQGTLSTPGRDDERSKEKAPCNAAFYLQRATCRVQGRHSKCNSRLGSAQPLHYNAADAAPDCSALRMHARRRHASGAAEIAPPRASSRRPRPPLCSPLPSPPTDDAQDVHGFPAALAVPKALGAMPSCSACWRQQAQDCMQRTTCRRQHAKDCMH